MLLTDEELRELTRRSQPASQIRVLRYMGIEHKVRPDGSIVVSRSHVQQVLGVSAISNKQRFEPEPNWSAI